MSLSSCSALQICVSLSPHSTRKAAMRLVRAPLPAGPARKRQVVFLPYNEENRWGRDRSPAFCRALFALEMRLDDRCPYGAPDEHWLVEDICRRVVQVAPHGDHFVCLEFNAARGPTNPGDAPPRFNKVSGIDRGQKFNLLISREQPLIPIALNG